MEENIKLLKSVLKRWKIILACTVIMAVVMYVLTMNMPREYISSATIYTGISTGQGIIGGQTDYMSQYSSYDNLTNIIQGRETLKEVGLRLLALHLGLKQPDIKIISAERLTEVRNKIPVDILNLVGETDSITYANLNAIADTDLFLSTMINSPFWAYYSIPALSSISVYRKGNSDMVQLSYKTNEQGISQKTLEILIEVSIKNYRQLKEGQTDNKLAFFEEELKLAQTKLKRAEAKEEEFKRIYDIADLPTQTGLAITDRQELDKQIAKERETMAAAQATMRQIDSKVGAQGQSMRRTDILTKRDQLSKLADQLTNARMNGASTARILDLQRQYEQVKSDLSNDLAENMTTTGTTSDAAATEYFSRLLTYTESQARMRALEAQKNATTGKFNRYLPLQDSLRRLQREIEICEKEYLAALEDRNKSRREQQDQRSFSNIEVYDKPDFPLIGKSKRMMMLMLGTMIGFLVPTSIFLGIAYLNNNIQTPQRAEEITGLKSAGILPNMNKLKDYKYPDMISNGLSDTILKSLYMFNYKSGQMRILMISTRQGEGKTTISNLLCERLNSKGRKCLVVMPYIEAGDWSVASYKVDKSFYHSRAEDIVPVEKMNDADILIIELPPLIMNDYPVDLIRQFDMAFLVCKANREWLKADQTALDSFIRISGISPHIILNEADAGIVEEVLGKVS